MSKSFQIVNALPDTEDNELQKSLVMRFLADQRNSIVGHCGVEALYNLKEHNHIDIVITDIYILVMGGLELIEIIRSNSLYSEMPIVIGTGQALTEQIELFPKAGSTCFIIKPFQLMDLFSIDRDATGGRFEACSIMPSHLYEVACPF